MKNALYSLLLVLTLRSVVISQDEQSGQTIPKYVSVELKQLEETWNILDRISTKIWPGWTTYSDVPFLFTFPNGVQMLVGHPNPPEGFAMVSGLEPRGKKVYLNRSRENSLEMKLPLLGGGGPIPFGLNNEKRVLTVSINLRMPFTGSAKDIANEGKDNFRLGSENQIVLYIHELFHCFQRAFDVVQHGNLMFNNDENYSTYAEIEGLALERAYLESNDSIAKDYLRDFVVARQLKRRSMNQVECLQESEEDVMEGTATYAEYETESLVHKGFPFIMTQRDDPFFYGFKYADSLRQEKVQRLRQSRANSFSSIDKCYPFGCFQAILLTRFLPEWRNGFFQDKSFLDQTIETLLAMTSPEREKVVKRLDRRYGYDTIYARQARILSARNSAYESIKKQKGVAYVVSFKNTGEFPFPEGSEQQFKVGLMYIYPHGIKRIKIADVLFEGNDTPMVNDQIYYVKWVDTSAKTEQKHFEVSGVREGNGNAYKDATFKTAGFTLSAPKLEIREGKDRVKVTVLEKVTKR